MSFNKQCGRLAVEVSRAGAMQHGYGYGAKVLCRSGWNDGCEMVGLTMSVDEMRDLRYMLGRAIAFATPSGGEG